MKVYFIGPVPSLEDRRAWDSVLTSVGLNIRLEFIDPFKPEHQDILREIEFEDDDIIVVYQGTYTDPATQIVRNYGPHLSLLKHEKILGHKHFAVVNVLNIYEIIRSIYSLTGGAKSSEIYPIHVPQTKRKHKKPLSHPVFYREQMHEGFSVQGAFVLTHDYYNDYNDLYELLAQDVIVRNSTELVYNGIRAKVRIVPRGTDNGVVITVGTENAGAPLEVNLAILVAKVFDKKEPLEPIALVTQWLKGYYVVVANEKGDFAAFYTKKIEWDELPVYIFFENITTFKALNQIAVEQGKVVFMLSETTVNEFAQRGPIVVPGIPEILWKTTKKMHKVNVPVINFKKVATWLITFALSIALSLFVPQWVGKWYIENKILPRTKMVAQQIAELDTQIMTLQQHQQASQEYLKSLQKIWEALSNARVFNMNNIVFLLKKEEEYGLTPRNVAFDTEDETIHLSFDGAFGNFIAFVQEIQKYFIEVKPPTRFKSEGQWNIVLKKFLGTSQ